MKVISGWRIKGKLKFFLILVFLISGLFLFYQLLYYSSLNAYQSEESERQIQEKEKSNNELKSLISSITPYIDFKDKKDHKNNNVYFGKLVHTSKILGVAPEHRLLYVRGNRKDFHCFSTGKILSWEKVNDDFCDCPDDGSDEPSTSACMNGKFYCSKTVKNSPVFIPSSRVNDLICDCCDGSDEYEKLSVISCKHRC